MKIITSQSDIPTSLTPISLTIGVFDGIHLGHQEIIKKLHKTTRKGGTRAVLTFSNHPSEVLKPETPTALITSFKHRLYLLQRYGIDLVIALPFTREFAEQSYSEFIIALRQKLPFNELILGEGAAFGKNQSGDRAQLQSLAEELDFKVHYQKKESHHRETISSDRIRTLITQGKLKQIKKLLGRPYSIWKRFNLGEVTRENEALYSWVFEEPELCMLPSGVYAIDFEGEGKSLPAIAFLNGNLVTIYLEKEPPESASANLSFVQYLHKELDPNLLLSPAASLLKKLTPEPSLGSI